jgi:hypothetical protein
MYGFPWSLLHIAHGEHIGGGKASAGHLLRPALIGAHEKGHEFRVVNTMDGFQTEH